GWRTSISRPAMARVPSSGSNARLPSRRAQGLERRPGRRRRWPPRPPRTSRFAAPKRGSCGATPPAPGPGSTEFTPPRPTSGRPSSAGAPSSALAYVPGDAQTRTRIRSVVDAKGEQALARWRAAFARAEGERDAARLALREALASGDRAAAAPLLDASIEDRDAGALHDALAALPADPADAVLADARRLAAAFPIDAARGATPLDAIAEVTHPRLAPWADALAAQVATAWIPPGDPPAAWGPLLARLDARAHAIGDLQAAARAGDLAADRARPVRLAIVGEFNAGKSTFINALIGADVAPTGVL